MSLNCLLLKVRAKLIISILFLRGIRSFVYPHQNILGVMNFLFTSLRHSRKCLISINTYDITVGTCLQCQRGEGYHFITNTLLDLQCSNRRTWAWMVFINLRNKTTKSNPEILFGNSKNSHDFQGLVLLEIWQTFTCFI